MNAADQQIIVTLLLTGAALAALWQLLPGLRTKVDLHVSPLATARGVHPMVRAVGRMALKRVQSGRGECGSGGCSSCGNCSNGTSTSLLEPAADGAQGSTPNRVAATEVRSPHTLGPNFSTHPVRILDPMQRPS